MAKLTALSAVSVPSVPTAMVLSTMRISSVGDGRHRYARRRGQILLQSRTPFQAATLLLIVAGLVWLVISNADDWSDWVVFGVIVLTTVGAAGAIYQRRYPTNRRTFVRHSEPPPRD